MTTPADPPRPGAPTVREIAALTARLREISARGRDVGAGEREQFRADKDALIARITDINTETGGGRAAGREPVMPEWMRETARAIEAAIAAGTLPDVYPDDTPALAARIADLRAEQAARISLSSGSAGVPEPEQERREQLTRWHADDQTDGHGAEHGDALTRFTCGGYDDDPGGTL